MKANEKNERRCFCVLREVDLGMILTKERTVIVAQYEVLYCVTYMRRLVR